MTTTMNTSHRHGSARMSFHRTQAERIAVEYARLSGDKESGQ